MTVLTTEEWIIFEKNIEEGLKHPTGPIPTPKLKEAEKLIRSKAMACLRMRECAGEDCKNEVFGIEGIRCVYCIDKVRPQINALNFLQVGAQQGWECPRCHTINSPWQHQCSCKPNEFKTTTSTDTQVVYGTGKCGCGRDL